MRILAFEKDRTDAERYRGGRFSALMQEKGAPDAINLFRQGKTLGDLKMWACSMALDVAGWDEDCLEPDLSKVRWD